MAVVYLLMGLLSFLLGLIAARYVLFGAVWILSGSSLWLFPHLLDDDVSSSALHGYMHACLLAA